MTPTQLIPPQAPFIQVSLSPSIFLVLQGVDYKMNKMKVAPGRLRLPKLVWMTGILSLSLHKYTRQSKCTLFDKGKFQGPFSPICRLREVAFAQWRRMKVWLHHMLKAPKVENTAHRGRSSVGQVIKVCRPQGFESSEVLAKDDIIRFPLTCKITLANVQEHTWRVGVKMMSEQRRY